MATVVIGLSILKQALLANAFISQLKRLDWGQPASVPFTMRRCTVISTWDPTWDRSYTTLRSVTQFPIRASQHPMSLRKSHWQGERDRIAGPFSDCLKCLSASSRPQIPRSREASDEREATMYNSQSQVIFASEGMNNG